MCSAEQPSIPSLKERQKEKKEEGGIEKKERLGLCADRTWMSPRKELSVVVPKVRP
jgi:hypothetical protein